MQFKLAQVWSALAFRLTAGKLLRFMPSQEAIRNALKAVKYPGYSRDIVSFGLIKDITIANGAVSVAMQLTTPSPDIARQIKEDSERVLKKLPDVKRANVEVRQPAAGQSEGGTNPFLNQSRVPGVKRTIARAASANPRWPQILPAH
jgi:ATP-binding protein involved in chromosome partitioning